MKKISVILPSNTNSTYDYLSPCSLELGSIVSIPFRNKEMIGIVWYDSNENIPFKKLKKITKVFHEIKFDKKFLSFLEFFRQYNLVSTGKMFKLVIPQNKLISSVKKSEFKRFLIDGVTGSGKTEIYFEAVNQVIKKGNQALILLPEISLVDTLVNRVHRRFGFEPSVWHSNTSPSKKKEIWKNVFNGNENLVIGAR